MEEQEKTVVEKLNEQIEQAICEIVDSDMVKENTTQLGELIDIHKDLANEEYWKIKKEEIKMRYREYGNYDNYNDYGNDSYGRRGRYRESGNYGRRGYDTKYKGEEMLDEMKYHYGNYRDSYNNGNYGAKEDSAKKMTDAFVEFGYAISKELEPNEKMMFKDAMEQIMQELER